MALTPELVARCFRIEPEQPSGANLTRQTDEEHAAMADRLLAGRENQPIWAFAYGSLLWKPVFAPDEVCRGSANGWHRAFTLRLDAFRGTPDRPGLMMGLSPGGRCAGLLLRLPEADSRAALLDLLKREIPFREVHSMVRWISVASDDGAVPALVFWAGAFPPLTTRGLTPEATARQIAQACGPGGSCADYLFQTVVQLEKHGIRDRNLWRLQELVAAEIASWEVEPTSLTA